MKWVSKAAFAFNLDTSEIQNLPAEVREPFLSELQDRLRETTSAEGVNALLRIAPTVSLLGIIVTMSRAMNPSGLDALAPGKVLSEAVSESAAHFSAGLAIAWTLFLVRRQCVLRERILRKRWAIASSATARS